MQKATLFSTLIMATVFMGCRPSIGYNYNDSAFEQKAIVVEQVSSGSFHTMIVKADDTLWAVGLNDEGQLGVGSTDEKSNPVKIMPGVAQVSAGKKHTIIVKKDHTLWAVGLNDHGQLGDDTTDRKMNLVQVKTADGPPMTDVDKVSAGGDHTMILKKNGDLWAVGLNDHGQLGDGTTTERWTPVQVKTADGPSMTDVAQVSAGSQHSMILKKNGDLWAVGLNEKGQLGDGTTTERWTPVQVKTADGKTMTEVAQISSGEQHTLILKENGDLWAVGNNEYGQLGDGTKKNKMTPVEVKTPGNKPMTKVAQVSSGQHHAMIVRKDGSLWAVGLNDHGQLGDGTDAERWTPVEVLTAPGGPPMTGVAQVSSGKKHSMILKQNGTLWAVGLNDHGQLGNGTYDRKFNPVKIAVEEHCQYKQ